MFAAVLPALIVVAVASAAGLVRWPVRPMTAVRALSVTAAVGAGTALFIAVVGVIGLLGRSAMVLAAVDWCPLVPFHHEIGVVEGGASVLVLAWSVWRIRRVLARRRWAIEGTEGRRLAVLDTSEPVAYAAPGSPGCVVVSRGMLDALEPKERQVLFAHERAHLDQHHHRFLLVAELAVAVLPTLRPLANQLRLATERSADEAAAQSMGDDRRLVARSIARAALSADEYRNLAGAFGGSSVPLRVDALMSPPPPASVLRAGATTAFAVSMLSLGAGGVQLHHIVELVQHLCHT
jgi:Zn-dependent protease with chaperone function